MRVGSFVVHDRTHYQNHRYTRTPNYQTPFQTPSIINQFPTQTHRPSHPAPPKLRKFPHPLHARITTPSPRYPHLHPAHSPIFPQPNCTLRHIANMPPPFWTIGCLYGASSVMLGAFGAHGLKKRIADPSRLANWGTAAQYQVHLPPLYLHFALADTPFP